MFGFARNTPFANRPLWQVLAPKANENYADRTAQRINDPDQKNITKMKWKHPRNPIKDEKNEKEAKLPSNQISEQKKLHYQRMKEEAMLIKDFSARQAMLNSIYNQEMKDLDQQMHDNIQYEGLNDFRDFLMGRGKPQMYAKLGWWDMVQKPKGSDIRAGGRYADMNHKPDFLKYDQPISRHDSVYNYIDGFIDSKMDYKKELAKLILKAQSKGPSNLSQDELWLLYKYVGLGMDPNSIIDDEFATRYFDHKTNEDLKKTDSELIAPVTREDQQEDWLAVGNPNLDDDRASRHQVFTQNQHFLHLMDKLTSVLAQSQSGNLRNTIQQNAGIQLSPPSVGRGKSPAVGGSSMYGGGAPGGASGAPGGSPGAPGGSGSGAGSIPTTPMRTTGASPGAVNIATTPIRKTRSIAPSPMSMTEDDPSQSPLASKEQEPTYHTEYGSTPPYMKSLKAPIGQTQNVIVNPVTLPPPPPLIPSTSSPPPPPSSSPSPPTPPSSLATAPPTIPVSQAIDNTAQDLTKTVEVVGAGLVAPELLPSVLSSTRTSSPPKSTSAAISSLPPRSASTPVQAGDQSTQQVITPDLEIQTNYESEEYESDAPEKKKERLLRRKGKKITKTKPVNLKEEEEEEDPPKYRDTTGMLSFTPKKKLGSPSFTLPESPTTKQSRLYEPVQYHRVAGAAFNREGARIMQEHRNYIFEKQKRENVNTASRRKKAEKKEGKETKAD